MRLGNNVYQVTKNLVKHQSILTPPSLEVDDEALTHANMFVNNYFDHIFVDNKQEQRIENFRKIVLDHSMRHL